MLLKILKEIEESYREPPDKLYARLVAERLDKALESYYHDIDLKTRSVLHSDDDVLKIVKKVVR